MTARQIDTVFQYLLDALIRHKEILIDDTLPIDVQEDLRFAQWMQSLDFSLESQLQNALRRLLEKQVGLVTSAQQRRLAEETPAPRRQRISLPALVGLIIGAISMITAALILIFRRPKEHLSKE
jgi:hypothetical protein